MQGNSLSTLDKAVQSAIDRELSDNDESPVAQFWRSRNIAGLSVVANASRDADVDEASAVMVDKLLRFRADRMLVTSRLSRVGVEPRAVLPVAAWEHLCDKTKLYRFTPVDDTVLVDGRAMVHAAREKAIAIALVASRKHSTRNFVAAMVLLPIIAVLGFTHLFPVGEFVNVWLGITAGASALMVAFLWAFPDNHLFMEVPAEEINAHLTVAIDAHQQAGTLFEQLWPKFREPDVEDGTEIRIILPKAPAEVQKRLISAERARLPIHIAVVGEAIGFKEPLVETLLDTEHGLLANEAAHAELDPIAYVVEGNAVAIIDQYGDFPIEHDVMNEVLNSEHLV
jgi:hypothetical protein